MSKIIAVSGAHGTGKTTKMYQLAYKHKIQYPGEIGIINEQVRLCPFPINQEADFKSQL
jgi:broad-specificity NMP kinase